MITGPLRSKIDKLWEEFWTGGIPNPLTVIEHISFLMLARLLDMRESTEEKKWSRKNPGKPFPGVYFPRSKQHLRWSHLKQEADADKILKIVRDEVFPHFRMMGEPTALAAGTTGSPRPGTPGRSAGATGSPRPGTPGRGVGGEGPSLTYTGDLITPQQWKHIKSEMFHGFDFDVTMLRIAAMNMMLHEIDTPDINYQDTLSTNFTDRKENRRWAE